MRRALILCVVVALLIPTFAWALGGDTDPMVISDAAARPLGYQQLTSLSASTPLTVPATAQTAIIECDSVAAKGVRWRDDGVAPTATVGMELLPGASFTYVGTLSSLRFIEVSSSAKLNVSYYVR
jgi:hypothetical protein